MEFVRELAPFLLGFIVSPIVIMAIPRKWSDRVRFLVSFVLSIVVGYIGSALVGEQVGELDERLIALVIDTSLAYAGAQLGYWILWKALLETRFFVKTPVKSTN